MGSREELARRIELQERRDESLVTLGLTLASLMFERVEDVCDTILSLAISETDASGGAILLSDLSDDGLPLHNRLKSVARSGLTLPADIGVAGAWSSILRDLMPAALSADEPGALPDLVPHRSGGRLLSVPVISRGDGIGAVVLQLPNLSPVDEPSMLRMLRIVSSIAAMSVVNVRNREAERALRDRIEDQAATARKDADARREALEKVEQQLSIIREQEAAIRSLSSPIIRVWDGVIALPVIGHVDSERAGDMTHRLLEQVVQTGSQVAIVDLTGVDHVDTHTTSHLLRMAQSVRLLGARCVLAGVTSRVARVMVNMHVEMGDTITFGDLRSALAWSFEELGYHINR